MKEGKNTGNKEKNQHQIKQKKTTRNKRTIKGQKGTGQNRKGLVRKEKDD